MLIIPVGAFSTHGVVQEAGKAMTLTDAYNAGLDCALNGANTTNCHFTLFATKELTKAWERGKAAGEERKKGK